MFRFRRQRNTAVSLQKAGKTPRFTSEGRILAKIIPVFCLLFHLYEAKTGMFHFRRQGKNAPCFVLRVLFHLGEAKTKLFISLCGHKPVEFRIGRHNIREWKQGFPRVHEALSGFPVGDIFELRIRNLEKVSKIGPVQFRE